MKLFNTIKLLRQNNSYRLVIGEVMKDNAKLEEHNDELYTEIKTFKKQIKELKQENEILRNRNIELEKRAK